MNIVSWNPVTGCTQVSPGCDHCYAKTLAEGRLKKFYPDGFEKLTLHEDRLEKPFHWRKPRTVFVCSMSDLFHEHIPESFLKRVFQVMEETPQHTYMVLTKRPGRMAWFAERYGRWPSNVWAGTSVESQKYAPRLDVLRRVPSEVRFVSAEPLLGRVDLNLEGIHWVIAGGESGPQSRKMEIDWVRQLRDACVANGVAFWFKQWGGRTPMAGGKLLDGRKWEEYPRVEPSSLAEVA